MTRRMERLMQSCIDREKSLEKVAKNLRNALCDLMDAEGGEPIENDEVCQAAWNRAEKALASYRVWKANN